MRFKFIIGLLFLFTATSSMGQCDGGEVPVHVEVATDNWGYENYWAITPAGNDCGDGTIAFGGNVESVGCVAENAGQPDDAGAYPNNAVILEGPFCLTEGVDYTIHNNDGFGDGGTDLTIYNNQVPTSELEGVGNYSSLTFTAGELPDGPAHQLPCGALDVAVDGPGAVVNNSGALTQLNEIHPPLENCGQSGFWCSSDGGTDATLWLKFEAPESGRVEVSTCNEDNGFDTELALYEVGDCANFETYNLIAANDDVPGGCQLGTTTFTAVINVSCLTPGEEYWIQLDGWNGSNGDTRVTVTDLGENPVVSSLEVLVDDVSCFGGEDGSLITEIFEYGVNYDVVISGPDGFEANSYFVEGLAAGDYTVSVTSGCGLDLEQTVTVAQAEPLLVSTESTPAGCNMSGTIDISIDGANPPYEFSWFFDQVNISDEQNLEGLEAGEYIYQITDENGCEEDGVVTVEPGDNFTIDLGNDTTICLNQELLLFGPAGAEYEWQDGSENQFFLVDASELGPGEYLIEVNGVDDLDCEDSDQILVTVDDCISSVGDLSRSQIALYPNPAKGKFVCDFGVETYLKSIEITDSRGRVVAGKSINGSLSESTLDISELKAGLYFVRISAENDEVVKKLVVD